MATFNIDHPIVLADKLAVFTCNNEINEVNVRWYFIKNWKTLTLGMDNSTILFIAGIHGKKTGKFGPNENIQTLKNQVRLFAIKIEGSRKLTRCGFGSYAQPTQVVYGSEVPYHSCCLPYRFGFWVGQLGYSGPFSFWGSF